MKEQRDWRECPGNFISEFEGQCADLFQSRDSWNQYFDYNNYVTFQNFGRRKWAARFSAKKAATAWFNGVAGPFLANEHGSKYASEWQKALEDGESKPDSSTLLRRLKYAEHALLFRAFLSAEQQQTLRLFISTFTEW